MLLLTHIIIALSSVAYTTYLFFVPSKRKFYLSYGLIALTLISGTALVIASHSALLPACRAGLTYLAAVLCALVAAHRRLAASSATDRS